MLFGKTITFSFFRFLFYLFWQQAETKITEIPEIEAIATTVDKCETTADETNDNIDDHKEQQQLPATIVHRNSNCFLLHPSPSEASLTRSQSFNLPPKTKHSPDCQHNPDKLID